MQADEGVTRTTQDAPLTPTETERVTWRQANEIHSLRATLTMYRRAANALAARNAALRAELDELRAAAPRIGAPLRAALADVRLTVEDAPATMVRAAVVAAVGGLVPDRVLEDSQLVAGELLASWVRRSDGASSPQATLRIDRVRNSIRIELQELAGHDAAVPGLLDSGLAHDLGLSIVQILSERWGAEWIASGRMRVWAYIAIRDRARAQAA